MHYPSYNKIIFIFVFPQALSRALPTNRGDWTLVNGDEEVNEAEETAAENTRVASIPSTLKATIKFGYEDGMVAALNGEDFDTYIAGVMTHTQAHYRHAASLGTTVEFEVCRKKIQKLMKSKRKNLQLFTSHLIFYLLGCRTLNT